MGLDMYLQKTKRVLKERSENELLLMVLADHWLTYVANNETCTFEEYCGANEALLEEVGGLVAITIVAELAKPNLKTLGEANLHTPEGVKHIVFRSIWEEIGRWRKANHIHKWFVDHVQGGEDNCEKYEVTKDDLLKLKDTCEKVLNLEWKTPKRLEKILPTQGGFFFGGTEYDEYYFSDVEATIEIINKVLETTDFEKELVVYEASW